MASFVGKVGILWISECGQTCVPSPPRCYNPNTGTKHWPSSSSSSSSSLPSSVFRTSSLATINKINIIRGRERRGQGEGFSIIRASTAENMATETTTTNTGEVVEKLGVQIHRNPPESKLAQLGVRNWPKWGCPPSKFPWTYSSKETCYLLKGKVKVYPDGSDEGVEIGAGDLVEFPNGMSCTWDVSEAVDKHYKFD